MEESLLTPEEQQVMRALAQAWNAFIALPILHEWDQREFMTIIHSAQEIVMSRPVKRQLSKQEKLS